MPNEPRQLADLIADCYLRIRAYQTIRVGRDDEQDVTNDTMLRAISSFDRYDRGRPFLPWIFRIAERAAQDHHRARGRRPRCTAELPPTLADVGPGPDELALRGLSRSLQRALAQLPPGHLEVVFLRIVADLSAKQTAAVLEITADNVDARLKRALDRLRRELETDRPYEPV